MIEATSCGGVVIFRGKILVLYKNYKNKYEGWVLPKGTVEPGEEYKETALREVKEETGVSAQIIKYIGKSQYSFNTPQDTVEKDVHWYLMMADSYYSKPQREEYFVDSGYYKFYEAYHLLKFSNEKQILEKAYNEYLDLKRSNLWGNRKYFSLSPSKLPRKFRTHSTNSSHELESQMPTRSSASRESSFSSVAAHVGDSPHIDDASPHAPSDGFALTSDCHFLTNSR